MSFGSLFKNEFYHQGGLVDVDINENKIKTMLEESESKFQELTLAHIEKIIKSK